MAGYVDPTKEAFAAFRADDRPGPVYAKLVLDP